ncbi:EexN family lipoprotein [Pseudomonas syringae]|uniref:EexN family lipoprotein n=1 Tax=Pseudomonas syringae group TaxID=136849 RepID=UPI000F0406F5|nr:EexN family lipoprotein [Pseudomonas viridiflava]
MITSRWLVLFPVLLTGCGADEAVRSVDWYKAHNAERAIHISECERDPGRLALTPKCVNAKQAENELRLAERGFRKRETLDLKEP